MKIVPIILLSFIASPVLACNAINGKYESHSETHWNFQLEINSGDSKLTYTDYFYGVSDARTDLTKVSIGYCEPKGEGYILTFAGQEVLISYHSELSHAAFGEKGSSPGVSGEFIEGQEVNLWISR